MHNRFYSRMAVQNLKKNRQVTIPYMLAGMGMVSAFYVMLALTLDEGVTTIHNGSNLQILLMLGCSIIGLFATIFLFYTNRFLMKRRNLELGLYNILGMEKRHIGRLMGLETLISGLMSVGSGLGLGMLLSKAASLLLIRLLQQKAAMGFSFHPKAALVTLVLFGCIYLAILLWNVTRVHFSKPIELLRSQKAGEKEPRHSWILTVLGVLALSGGYVMALRVQRAYDAIGLFFFAVLLVILGTYCLFTSGSIALLKLLRRNTHYYYQTKHFISVSGMMYRMKQNAVGLANICILACAVLVMMSTTVSLYVGQKDAMDNDFPWEFTVNGYGDTDPYALRDGVRHICKEQGVTPLNESLYTRTVLDCFRDGNRFFYDMDEKGNMHTEQRNNGDAHFILLTAEFYEGLIGQEVELLDNEVILYAVDVPMGNILMLGDTAFTVKEHVNTMRITGLGYTVNYKGGSFAMVVKDEGAIGRIRTALYSAYWEYVDIYGYKMPTQYLFDTELSVDDNIRLMDIIRDWLQKDTAIEGYVDSRSSQQVEFMDLYGGLFFLGIILGLLFIVATVLIMYYKQISEGYEDKRRFQIMQQVGLSRSEVRASIRSQVLTVFFLPLIAAGVHIAVAFKMIYLMLGVLRLSNITLFAHVAAAVYIGFALLYTLVYILTAGTYTRIVES